MTLQPGTTLGSYEVVAPLGAGGMGEVYRARDNQLGREVAIKVLPEALAGDPERMQRFEREAKALAALNHPNVATLHGFEKHDGTPFLVMELVSGETLADRIKQGAMPLGEALPLFLQIAEGLEAAHTQGVIHRDLKPANIMLTAEGVPKILDFGLAKAAASGDPVSGGADLSQSPTLTLAATQRGEILGTAAYMSPEQARGVPIDKRADVWAFGVCLLEALSGKRVFDGEDASFIMAAVLTHEPRWDSLPESTPQALRRLLRRCLAKHARDRLRDIGDVALELRDIIDSPLEEARVTAAVESTGPSRPSALWMAAAAIVAAAIAALAVWTLKPEPPPRIRRSIVNSAASAAVAVDPNLIDVAITPDGNTVVYSTSDGLFVRRLGELGGQPLAGAEGGISPFVSPDGEWVGYFDQLRGELRKVSILGGPPVRITSSGYVAGATWGEDDSIVFTSGPGATEVQRVAAGGGDAETISLEGNIQFRWPTFLPGDSAVLLAAFSSASVEQAQIALLDLETRQLQTLVPGGSRPFYVPTGHIVYALDGTLRAVPFDLSRREVLGNPVPILDGVVTKGASGGADYAFADDGTLVYVTGNVETGLGVRLVWVDRQGNEEDSGLDPRAWGYPSLSPDGESVALTDFNNEQDIWIWNFARQTPTRLTFDPSLDIYAIWARDGHDVYFTSSRTQNGGFDIYRRAADGTGAAELVADNDSNLIPTSISPDGRTMVYRAGMTGIPDLGILSLEGDRVPSLLLASEFAELNASISPDGKWLAYQSNESGRDEVYVRPFPKVEDGRWQVSRAGGREPLWGPKGSEVLYRSGGSGGQVLSVAVETDAGFSIGTPQPLFADHYETRIGRSWDVHPDGDRFLMVSNNSATGGGGGRSAEIVLVQDWFDELERLVPRH